MHSALFLSYAEFLCEVSRPESLSVCSVVLRGCPAPAQKSLPQQQQKSNVLFAGA